MLNKSIYIFVLLLTSLIQACGGGGGGDGGGPDPVNSITAYAELSWIHPMKRIDGTRLLHSDIAGYRVYYGTDNHNLEPIVDIDGSYIDSYSVGVSTAGIYYFAISAYDTHGLESELSNVVLKEAFDSDI